jgi:nicotinamide-nucleotide amidase
MATGKTIALAESCTGGLVAHRLTRVEGVGPHFPGAIVSYGNEIKSALLGVPDELLATKGAVSPEVAEAMAEGVRTRMGADLGLSVTGIAGPTGGTPEKPVGLVYLGMADASGTRHRRLELGPEQPRHVIQSRSAKHAMNWARLALRGKLP